MIKVDLDKIITAQALQEHLERILFEVEEDERLFVITKKGRPRAALINVDYLEEITGRSVQHESREYDRYDDQVYPEKPLEEEENREQWATAGAPNRIEPVPTATTTAPTATTTTAPTATTAPTTPTTEPATETEPELDLPELSIDDLAFDDEPAAEQSEAAEPPKNSYSAPQLSTLLDEPAAIQNDAIQLNVPEPSTELPEDWAKAKMPVPPTPEPEPKQPEPKQ